MFSLQVPCTKEINNLNNKIVKLLLLLPWTDFSNTDYGTMHLIGNGIVVKLN